MNILIVTSPTTKPSPIRITGSRMLVSDFVRTSFSSSIMSARLSSRPSHSNGRVMSSGSSWWSMSIMVRAISAHVNRAAPNSAGDSGKCHARASVIRPVASSSRG